MIKFLKKFKMKIIRINFLCQNLSSFLPLPLELASFNLQNSPIALRLKHISLQM